MLMIVSTWLVDDARKHATDRSAPPPNPPWHGSAASGLLPERECLHASCQAGDLSSIPLLCSGGPRRSCDPDAVRAAIAITTTTTKLRLRHEWTETTVLVVCKVMQVQ